MSFQKYCLQRLQATDPRIKILLSVIIGICTWQAGPIGLGVFGVGALLLSWVAAGQGLFSPGQVRALVGFVLIWTGIKAGLEAVGHNPLWWEQSLALGTRLVVLVLVGLSLAAVTSRIQVGRAVTSLLRPFWGRKSWQGAMALALMIHFIPLTMRTLSGVRRTLLLRGQALSLRHRLRLYVQTVMRSLSRSTWDQTLALAVRGLETEQAWQYATPWMVSEWVTAVLVALALVGVSLV